MIRTRSKTLHATATQPMPPSGKAAGLTACALFRASHPAEPATWSDQEIDDYLDAHRLTYRARRAAARTGRALHHTLMAATPALTLALIATALFALMAHQLALVPAAALALAALLAEHHRADRSNRPVTDCPLCARASRRATHHQENLR
ncbi:hypothetical protein ACFYZH_31930 [Streptomyces abikoensis]|uniref:hypothetical protein n=1 Tax=Streptomyces abikoensis TaxID=97398 RepID=UPI0036B6A5B7